MLLGPRGSAYLSLTAPVERIVDGYVATIADLADAGVRKAAHIDRLEEAIEAEKLIREFALAHDNDSPDLRRRLGLCVGCGARLIDRGKAEYCTDQCKSAARKARGRAKPRDQAPRIARRSRSSDGKLNRTGG